MGKLIADQSVVVMATKIPAPTNEQLRIAQLYTDKEDQTALKKKCQQVMETTNCTEHEAMLVLHDCNYDLNEAVTKYFDGKAGQGEWQTSGKKTRKAYKEHENHSTSHDDVYSSNAIDDFPSTPHDSYESADGMRLGPGDPASRVGANVRRTRMTDGYAAPFRGRGRGFTSSRGPRIRSRGFVSNENGEHSTDRSSYRTGRPGGRGFNSTGSSSRENFRGGRPFARGSFNRRQRENTDSGFEGGISTWKNDEVESNMWNNDMAAGRHIGSSDDVIVDQWKGPECRTTSAPPSNDQDDSMWHNSMAQQTTGAGRGRRNSGVTRNAPLRSDYHQRRVQAPVTNHIDDWNSTGDDWDEEKDWQKMGKRVFTNVKVNQTSQSVTSSAATSIQPLTPAIITAPNAASPPSSAALPSAVDVGVRSPLAPVISQQTVLATVTQNIESTGLNSHVRGESITVNHLFGQKSTPNDVISSVTNDSSSGQRNKQATDTIRNELGIGKAVVAGLDQTEQSISRTHSVYASHKPATSKVEMPNTVPNVGQIDVEFGEFTSVNKLRPILEDQQNYFDFTATATQYAPSELGMAPTQSQAQSMPATVYQPRTPSKDLHQYHQQQQQPSVQSMAPPAMTHYAPATSGSVVDFKTPTSTSTLHDVAPPSPATPSASSCNGVNAGVNVVVNRTSVTQSVASQVKAQQPGLTSGMHAQQQQQRQYLSNNGPIESCMTSQVNRDLGPVPPMIQTQSIAGVTYNSSAANRSAVTASAASKPTLNMPALFNPATNATYQQALAAAMPYLYPAADQNYLNSLQFLSPPAATYPFSALGALPFDLSSLSVRDNQQAINAGPDGKTYLSGRIEAPMTSTAAAPTSGMGGAQLNAPPGLGGGGGALASAAQSTVSNLGDQQQAAAAAALLAATPAAAFHYPTLMQAGPYLTQFVVPTVTNSSASTVNAANHYKNNGIFASPQAMYYNGDIQLSQDYSKSIYGLTVAQASAGSGKQQSATGATNLGAQDKGYAAPNLKVFDGKTFQHNTATPPPGMGGVGFPPGAAAATFHSSGQAAAYSAYPPQFLTHPINMIPHNVAAQAQAVNQGDMFANAGQRVGNAGAKSGANIYQAKGWNT